MSMFRTLVSMTTAAMLVSVTACNSVSTTNGVTTVNVSLLQQEANVISVLATSAVAAGQIEGVLSATDSNVATLQTASADALQILAKINAATGGTITVDTSTTWEKGLTTDAQTIINVLQSVLAGNTTKTAVNVEKYLADAQAILPYLESLVATVNNAVAVVDAKKVITVANSTSAIAPASQARVEMSLIKAQTKH